MSEEYFGEDTEDWKWKTFKSTNGFKVSSELIDWIIGQDKAIREARLCIDEWVYKLTWLKKAKWWKKFEDPLGLKPQPKEWLPSGPFLLLLGEPSTGKSLLGRAMSSYMTKVYRDNKIQLYDVLSWKNPVLPSEPKISIHVAGKGRELVISKCKHEEKRGFLKKWGTKILMGILGGFGVTLLSIGIWNMITMIPIFGLINAVIQNAIVISIGGSLMFFAFFIWHISRLLGNFGSGGADIGGAARSDAPKLLVDNSSGRTPFVDACLIPETMMLLNPRFSTLYKEGDKTFGLCGQTQDIINVNRKQWEGQIISIKPRLLPEVKITENHPVLIYRPTGTHFNMDEAKRLISKDFKWVKAKDLRKGDILKIHISTLQSQFIEIPEDLAWLYGIYVAEGYCKKEGFNWNSKKHGERWARELGFTFGFHERELVEKTKSIFKKYFNYELKEDLHNSQEIQLICYSTKLCRQFKSMFGDSAKTKRIPHDVFYTSKLAKRNFLKGFEEGDEDSTASKQLFYDLIALHLLLGEIPSTHVRMTKGGVIKGRQIKPSLQYTVRMNGSKYKHYFRISNNEILLPVREVCQTYYKGEIINPETEDGIIPLPFITHNTGHGSAQLFGSIAWDPYQTGGLGTPEHQRVSAGDVHRGHLGVLFIDEIKNLTGPEAITLLTVLEDGQLPIALRSLFHGGDTAAMAVSTEPIPCMTFLIAAGNLDSLPQIHPALLDRLQGYGKVVYMNNDMQNTIDNRRKFVQFISQEIQRFHLLPLNREACIGIIEEARRKSGKKDYLTCKFRPMISIIKTASTLAKNEGKEIVEDRHVKEALLEHCKTIGVQVMEKYIENQELYITTVNPKEEPKVGTIHGLGVSCIGDDMVGEVAALKASMIKREDKDKMESGREGYFKVTGANPHDDSYIQNSIAKVRSVILKKYGIDVAQDYFTHVDFCQEHNVEGSSAGITMTLALISCLTGKKIRQDIAVTGEINIDHEGKMVVTAIGGSNEKIMAAERWGFSKVIIPKRNYEKNINPKDYKIEVIGCETLDEYMNEILVD